MIDVKILAIKDILEVNDVRFLPGVSPPSLRIFGRELREADEVHINDIRSPEFMAVSSTEILAQIPTSQRGSSITSIAVLATRPSPTRRSLLRFEVGRTISRLQGLERLVQWFIKMLLQTPGTDIFDPTSGGGLQSLLGRVVSRGDSTALAAGVVQAVNRTRDQIITKQSRQSRIPPDERLLRADTQAVGFHPNTSTLAARVSIGAVSGRQAVTNLTF